MRSQEAFNLFQSAREINVALASDGERIGGLLNEQNLQPVAEGETAFDHRQQIGLMSSQLSSTVEAAVLAEDAHSDQLIRVSRAQDERNEIAETGYAKLLSARQCLESLYKRGGYELAFFSGDTPRAPKRLVEQLGQSVKLLQRPVVAQRTPKIRGFSVDPKEMALDLEESRTELIEVLGRVDEAKKKAEVTVLARRDALDTLRRTISWVGNSAERLFQRAGETELAERIRSSTSRPRRPSEIEADAAADAQVSAEPAPDSQVSSEPASDSQVASEPAPDSQVTDEPASDSQLP